jgi:hypothetical protein
MQPGLRSLAGLCCAMGLALSLAGCLSLSFGSGEKKEVHKLRDTYIQDTPETMARIEALEARVAALEGYSASPVANEPLPAPTPLP